MARTMSILLGVGLAGLALVGCSKNNIAGPEKLTNGQDQAAFVRLPAPVDDSQSGDQEADRLETANDLGEIIDRAATADADGRSDGELIGRPVAVDDGGSGDGDKGRLVVMDGEDKF